MSIGNIHTLAAAVTGTGTEPEVVIEFRGNSTGVLFIDLNGATFTATIQGRAEDGDTWLSLAVITNDTDPVQEIVLAPLMRINVSAFSATTLTVKVTE